MTTDADNRPEKIFLGSVRLHKFNDGNSVINMGMTQDDVDLLLKYRDERGYTNFSIKKSIKNPESFYAEIYVAKTASQPVAPVAPVTAAPVETGMPF